MNIREIAEEINQEAWKFKMGHFQEIRTRIKDLKRQPGNRIFTEQTIFSDYAFHYGGRKEIQYNIGMEVEGLRYGLAFSIDTSISLPDVSVLYPKIDKLNNLYEMDKSMFSGYKFWYFHGIRSDIMEMQRIPEELKRPKTFIFFGKLVDMKNINIIEILKEFDKMLDIYIKVETK